MVGIPRGSKMVFRIPVLFSLFAPAISRLRETAFDISAKDYTHMMFKSTYNLAARKQVQVLPSIAYPYYLPIITT